MRGEAKLVTLQISNGKFKNIVTQNKILKPKTGFSGFDAGGKLVLPGFIDCHCHLFSVGEIEKEVNLRGCNSIAEMRRRIVDFEQRANFIPPGVWMFGRGWDQDNFQEGRMPSSQDLDSLPFKRPLVMVRICGHVAVLNSLALDFLERAGAFRDANNETYEKDGVGSRTGIVKETSLAECWKILKVSDLKELKNDFLLAQSRALGFGIIGVHTILSENWRNEIEAIRRLDEENRLILKTSIFLPIEALESISSMKKLEREKFLAGKRFEILGFKLFADGSLGARTAALKSPYSDDPENTGILNYDSTTMTNIVKGVKKSGLILAVHAIGDRAIEQVLECFSNAGVSRKDRFRIEHVSVLRTDLVQKLGIPILCVQPMFASSDYWIEDRIGSSKRTRFAYTFKTLSKRSTLIAGSDAPVETLNPISSIEAACYNRTDPEESLSLDQSLELYTSNAAKLSPITLNSGKIKKGSACDFIVLCESSIDQIFNSKVIKAFIDGQIVFG